MARAKSICPRPGCPRIKTGTRYCADHEREYEAKRGSKKERDYGRDYQAQRRWWKTRVDLGLVDCARCHKGIHPGTEWALDHDDDDRTKILGPSHKFCNDSAGGKASHRYD